MPLVTTALSCLLAKIPELWSHAYDRVKPSGAIFAFEMVRVVDGPMAANAPGMSEKTVNARAIPAERNI